MKTTTVRTLLQILALLIGVLIGYGFGQMNCVVPPQPAEYTHAFILTGCLGGAEWLIEINGPDYHIAHASQVDRDSALEWAKQTQPLVIRVPRKVCM